MADSRFNWYVLNADATIDCFPKHLKDFSNEELKDDMVTKAWLVDELNDLEKLKVVVGCIALRANRMQIMQLIMKWDMFDEKVQELSKAMNVDLKHDNTGLWIATYSDSQTSHEGRSTTAAHAMGALAFVGKQDAFQKRSKERVKRRSR